MAKLSEGARWSIWLKISNSADKTHPDYNEKRVAFAKKRIADLKYVPKSKTASETEKLFKIAGL